MNITIAPRSSKRPRIRRAEYVTSSDRAKPAREPVAPLRSVTPASTTTRNQRGYLLTAAALFTYGRDGVHAALSDFDAHLEACGRAA